MKDNNKNKNENIAVSGYLVKFNQVDCNGDVFTPSSINIDDMEKLKIRGKIIYYEINKEGVKVIKHIKLDSASI